MKVVSMDVITDRLPYIYSKKWQCFGSMYVGKHMCYRAVFSLYMVAISPLHVRYLLPIEQHTRCLIDYVCVVIRCSSRHPSHYV